MNEKDFIQKLSDFLVFCETEAPDDFKSDLVSMGLDPIKLAQKGEAFAKRLLASRALRERDELKEQRVRMQTKLASLLEVLKTPADVDAVLAQIVAGTFGANAQQYVGVHFKDFKKASLDDKRSLLADIELLKYMAEQESNKKND
jgi:hypothetical protein